MLGPDRQDLGQEVGRGPALRPLPPCGGTSKHTLTQSLSLPCAQVGLTTSHSGLQGLLRAKHDLDTSVNSAPNPFRISKQVSCLCKDWNTTGLQPHRTLRGPGPLRVHP